MAGWFGSPKVRCHTNSQATVGIASFIQRAFRFGLRYLLGKAAHDQHTASKMKDFPTRNKTVRQASTVRELEHGPACGNVVYPSGWPPNVVGISISRQASDSAIVVLDRLLPDLRSRGFDLASG